MFGRKKKEKVLVDTKLTQESLIRLRDEMYSKPGLSAEAREAFFKINSCLHGEYPVNHSK